MFLYKARNQNTQDVALNSLKLRSEISLKYRGLSPAAPVPAHRVRPQPKPFVAERCGGGVCEGGPGEIQKLVQNKVGSELVLQILLFIVVSCCFIVILF